ncbi:MAG: hypothetical protein N4A62_18330 [Marinisporobacter sp.]|jgi:hypothetical protein|nr:hypothetical protein [Marinisporobacter sp.]
MSKNQRKQENENKKEKLKFRKRPISSNIKVIKSGLEDLDIDIQALVKRLLAIQLKEDKKK